jgi:hypothetical protein
MITYKNITDVEVLEQASENTKVLVNEGGELMQAPYSNFEDKMSNAEVLEEIPENAMALVNDGGELKQVACKEMGGNSSNGWVTIVYKDGVFTSDTTLEEMFEMCATYKFKGISLIRYNLHSDNKIDVLFCTEINCYEDYYFISFRAAGGGTAMVDIYWRQSGIEEHNTPV